MCVCCLLLAAVVGLHQAHTHTHTQQTTLRERGAHVRASVVVSVCALCARSVRFSGVRCGGVGVLSSGEEE